MVNLTEVFFPETEQRGAVELSIAADVVISVRMELFAVLVVPNFFGLVFSFEVYGAGIPVVFLPRNIAAPFQEQDALAGGRQLVSQGAPAGASTDNNDIKVVLGGLLELLSARGYWFASLFRVTVTVSLLLIIPLPLGWRYPSSRATPRRN
jgi:hypothetical protein